MYKSIFKNVLGDIRFWIVLLFLLRLYGIENPPLETGHNWRQSLTNMIARNFYEEGVNLLYPTIDMAGEKAGIIGTEFPFYNYLTYLYFLIFDFAHWPGRLINLIVSSTGLLYFFKLVKKLTHTNTAFNATIVLGVSIWFAFSRKIMPDTFSTSLVIIGLYHGYNYLKSGYKWTLGAFFIFSMIGLLCKIPALSLFSVIALVPFIKSISAGRKIIFIATAILAFIITCTWYFYWVPYLIETYRYELYTPKGIMEGINEIKPLIPELFEKFYFSALHSYIALFCCISGLIILLKGTDKLLKIAIGIISMVFVVFIIKTGAIFPLHNYYIVPYVPVMALLAGYAISHIPQKFQVLILCLIGIEGIANQQHDFRIKDDQLYKLKLEGLTKEIIPKDDMIIINGGPSPQDMYFAHKKGWTARNSEISNPSFVDSLNQLGAKFLILDNHKANNPHVPYNEVYKDENYTILKLEN